jgi:sphingolipid 4-desaturase/C4-monooxygenase
MGHEPLTKYIVLAVLALQLTMAFLLRHTHPFSWKFVAAAYVIGGTANHNLFLAIHEITHNLAFKGIKANKVLAILANLPIGVPYSISFKVSDIFAIIMQILSFHMSGLRRGII